MFVEMVGNLDLHLHKQVPELVLPGIDRHSKSRESELFAVWRSLRNIDRHVAFECLDLSLSAEDSSIQFNGEDTVEIVPLPVEFRVRRYSDGEIEVPVWTAACSGPPFACNS